MRANYFDLLHSRKGVELLIELDAVVIECVEELIVTGFRD